MENELQSPITELKNDIKDIEKKLDSHICCYHDDAISETQKLFEDIKFIKLKLIEIETKKEIYRIAQGENIKIEKWKRK